MTPLQNQIIKDLTSIEKDLGIPTFLWNTTSYPFIPSISEFKRELETGGFQLVRLLTATVRRLNCDGSTVFTTLPTAQQIINYSIDGNNYRIESVKIDPTNTHFRLIAHSTTKGA